MINETVAHYGILRIRGSGGMGVVYEAEDAKLGRRVALGRTSAAPNATSLEN